MRGDPVAQIHRSPQSRDSTAISGWRGPDDRIVAERRHEVGPVPPPEAIERSARSR